MFLNRNVSDFENLAVGSAQQNISKRTVEKLNCIIPDKKLLAFFEQDCKPIFGKWEYNLKEINKISQLRDTLLPKLTSGKIRIPEAHYILKTEAKMDMAAEERANY